MPRDVAGLALAAVCSVPPDQGSLGADHLRAAAKHRECCNSSQVPPLGHAGPVLLGWLTQRMPAVG